MNDRFIKNLIDVLLDTLNDQLACEDIIYGDKKAINDVLLEAHRLGYCSSKQIEPYLQE